MRPTWGIVILITLSGCQSSDPLPPLEPEPEIVLVPATAPSTQPSTPTDVFRALLLAIMNGDRAAGEALIVPHPHSEILWINRGAIPEPQQSNIRKLLPVSVTLFEVKPGTDVQLPGNRVLRVTEDMVDPNRKLYWPMLSYEKMPTPFWFQRSPGGSWKVDAGPLIAARQAAERYRQEQSASRPATRADDRR
jgi:hypothetical protein